MNGLPMDAVVTAIGGVVIAAVIVLVIFSGRMSKAVRSTVEIVVGILLFPTVTGLWGWRAIEGVRDRDWLYAGLMAIAAAVFAVTGFYAIRRRTLAPFAKRPK